MKKVQIVSNTRITKDPIREPAANANIPAISFFDNEVYNPIAAPSIEDDVVKSPTSNTLKSSK